MTDEKKAPPAHVADIWANLRPLTAARIGLKRTGASLATEPLLDFRLAHARARDAVGADFDSARVASALSQSGLPILTGESAAPDKRTYLMRPDLGRRLAPEIEASLGAKTAAGGFDVAITVSDGLSAQAVEAHAAPLLLRVLPKLRDASLSVAPLAVLRHGRVAIGDRVAELLGARCAVVLIGERPGLSAPDSMGAYLTWKPGASTTDADRNCISNIRPDGIGYDDAAFKLVHLVLAIRAHGLSGVALKDTSDSPKIVSS
ncbi:MAG: ethanolamine ammonia-lyase subunit EutC [Pseudolabrys sp.]|jgi:ethanolamine ammonia-lyase small subunit